MALICSWKRNPAHTTEYRRYSSPYRYRLIKRDGSSRCCSSSMTTYPQTIWLISGTSQKLVSVSSGGKSPRRFISQRKDRLINRNKKKCVHRAGLYIARLASDGPKTICHEMPNRYSGDYNSRLSSRHESARWKSPHGIIAFQPPHHQVDRTSLLWDHLEAYHPDSSRELEG